MILIFNVSELEHEEKEAMLFSDLQGMESKYMMSYKMSDNRQLSNMLTAYEIYKFENSCFDNSFYLNDEENLCYTQTGGVMILPLFVGQGKSYTSIKYINDMLLSEAVSQVLNKKIYLYITNLKVNIPFSEIDKYPDLKNIHSHISSVYDSVYNFVLKRYLSHKKNKKATIDDLKATILTEEFEQLLKMNLDSIKVEMNMLSLNKKKFTKKTSYYENLQRLYDLFHYHLDGFLEYAVNHVAIVERNKNDMDFDLQGKKDGFIKEEQKFRKELKRVLRSLVKFNGSTYCIKTTHIEISDVDAFDFVFEMYPASTLVTLKYKFFTMTVDKFLFELDPLFSKTVNFFNSQDSFFDKNDVTVFVDEFDRAFATMSSHIYDNILLKIDILSLVTAIINGRDIDSLPQNIISMETSRKHVEAIFEIIEEYKKNYEYLAKYCAQIDDDTLNTFGNLYYLYTNSLVHLKDSFDNTGYPIVLNYDDELNTNVFSEDTTGVATLTNSVNSIVFSFYSLIHKIIVHLNRIVYDYYSCEKEKRKNSNSIYMDLTLNNALSSVLSAFNWVQSSQEELFKFFSNNLIFYNKNMHSRKGRFKSITDVEYYNTAHNLIEIVQTNEENENHKLSSVNMITTPENMLTTLLSRVKVIGMSATATVDTVINNFSLDYLENFCLENDLVFFRINQKVNSKLKLLYDDYNNYDFEDIDISVNSVSLAVDKSTSDNLVDLSLNFGINDDFFDTDELKDFHDELMRLISFEHFTSDVAYLRKNIVSFIKGIDLALDRDIRSILCFNTANYGKSENYRDLTNMLIKLIFLKYGLCSFADLDTYFSEHVYSITSWDTKNNILSEIKKKLAYGEMVIVITSYNTIGQGQNLQYPVPFKDLGNYEKVKVLNEDARLKLDETLYLFTEDVYYDLIEKYFDDTYIMTDCESELFSKIPFMDFGAIYCGVPTNIVPMASNKRYENEWLRNSVKRRDDILRCEASGYMDRSDAYKHIYSSLKGGYKVNLNDCLPIKRAKLVLVLQALGRIFRTSVKESVVCVSFAKELLSLFDWSSTFSFELAENQVLSEIVDMNLKLLQERDEEKQKRRADNLSISRRNNAYIEKTIYKALDRDLPDDVRLRYIEENDEFRDFLIKNIVIDDLSELDKINPIYRNFYVATDGYYKVDCNEFNKYYYNSIHTGGRIYVTNITSRRAAAIDGDHVSEVSADDLNIKTFFKCKEMREKLLELLPLTDEGEFRMGKYMLDPVCYNVVKGYIGEYIFKFIFEAVFGDTYEIKNLDDCEYESFDFLIEDVYVDVKFHKRMTFKNMIVSDYFHRKIFTKLESNSLDKALILNVNPIDNEEGIMELGNVLENFSKGNKSFNTLDSCYIDFDECDYITDMLSDNFRKVFAKLEVY